MLLDRLFVVFRDSIDEHASDPVPLVVLEVLEFDLGQLGITRVTSIAPHSLWKANHPDKAARVEVLVDRRYDCFSRACQSVYAAYQLSWQAGLRSVHGCTFAAQRSIQRSSAPPPARGCAAESG